ncbi:MAG TPA: outer membrane lipoprotein-sorting protein [Candidatus Limnocylindria bacterium]|nr:outer membrane lipoprotein-sorting protein [Candidatus Limnocylindria bacterium]
MKGKRWAALPALWLGLCIALASGSAAISQNHAPLSLETVLHQLDSAARDFHSLSAEVERTKVTVVVNDRSAENGTILVRGDKMLLQMKAPDARTILRTGDNIYIYNPGLKRVEEYNLGKNRALFDQYLLLGFGTAGKELQKHYLVTLLGEPVLDDKKTAQIELTPKSEQVRNNISKIQIWFDESSWLPVQQQFYETGSGDYFIIRYSKLARNPDLGDARFKPHWPKGTEKIKPQG